MNWDAIGAIGELVGALVVVVTIVYLAAQIRQNTIATKLSTSSTYQKAYSDVELTIASNPELADLLRRSRTGAELSNSEKLQQVVLYRTIFRAWQNTFSQHKLGAIEMEVWQ